MIKNNAENYNELSFYLLKEEINETEDMLKEMKEKLKEICNHKNATVYIQDSSGQNQHNECLIPSSIFCPNCNFLMFRTKDNIDLFDQIYNSIKEIRS